MSTVEERRFIVFVVAFSVVNSCKTLIFNNNVFSPQDYFGAAITIALIFYMEIYRDREGYQLWIIRFKSPLKNLVLIFMGAFLIFLVWGFEQISGWAIGTNEFELAKVVLYFVTNITSYILLTLGICCLILPFLRFLSVKLDMDAME
ncbi:hypothetical protein [Enterococcus rivorum]|uniref:Uncharacterized protein n=1 Tax=Enterococcus rivorum TaxID=762845 RepID=A0A1E5KV81_9ENTE|nr:hypothetical protein [Enterococcus rivorum]MBP2100656.1 hypothetical protein [Enterococcus rivorum]OEH81499.1 hypothetical protein BCR26_04455 [Enterococcus rivorum]